MFTHAHTYAYTHTHTHTHTETTGLADPAPVVQTFFVDDDIKAKYSLDAVITVVDAKHIMERLREVKPKDVENESVEQVRFCVDGF